MSSRSFSLWAAFSLTIEFFVFSVGIEDAHVHFLADEFFQEIENLVLVAVFDARVVFA